MLTHTRTITQIHTCMRMLTNSVSLACMDRQKNDSMTSTWLNLSLDCMYVFLCVYLCVCVCRFVYVCICVCVFVYVSVRSSSSTEDLKMDREKLLRTLLMTKLWDFYKHIHVHIHTHTITFHLPRPQIHKLSHYKDKLMPYSQLRLIAYTDIKPWCRKPLLFLGNYS